MHKTITSAKKVLIGGLSISSQNTGVQYYSKYLFETIAKKRNENLEIEMITHKKRGYKNPFYRVFYEIFLLNKWTKQNNISLYHATNYIVPFFLKSKVVLTVHDLIAIDYPKLCKNTSVVYFNLFLRRSLKKAIRVITVSETVKKDIVMRYGIPQGKIKVVPLAVDKSFKRQLDFNVKRKYDLPEKYLLFVGNLEAKKNLNRLINAFELLKKENAIEHQLVLVGKKGWKTGNLKRKTKQLGLKDQVRFLGYVPKEDLPTIYSLADLFVFPSIYEGFGIPPLEAMSCETPVLISSHGASPEVCEDAGFIVDPYCIKDIAKGIMTILTNKELQRTLIHKGKEQVKKYSWNKTALETIKVYEEICF